MKRLQARRVYANRLSKIRRVKGHGIFSKTILPGLKNIGQKLFPFIKKLAYKNKDKILDAVQSKVTDVISEKVPTLLQKPLKRTHEGFIKQLREAETIVPKQVLTQTSRDLLSNLLNLEDQDMN